MFCRLEERGEPVTGRNRRLSRKERENSTDQNETNDDSCSSTTKRMMPAIT
jgi:hypothetical protein